MAENHPGEPSGKLTEHASSHEHSEGGERMREVIRDGFTIMVGAASWAFDQGDRLVDSWLHQGRQSREEGQRRINDLADRTRRARDDFGRRVQDSMRSARSSMPLATRDQVANLERQVAQLTREIEALRAQNATSGSSAKPDRPARA
jgi:polyhydroxyalkanoate synthesis regulator phasin